MMMLSAYGYFRKAARKKKKAACSDESHPRVPDDNSSDGNGPGKRNQPRPMNESSQHSSVIDYMKVDTVR